MHHKMLCVSQVSMETSRRMAHKALTPVGQKQADCSKPSSETEKHKGVIHGIPGRPLIVLGPGIRV